MSEAEGAQNTPGENAPAGDTLIGEVKPEGQATPEAGKPQEAGSPDPAAEGAGNEPTKEQDAEGDKSEKVGAPEEYEDFKAPEGVELNGEVIDAFKPLAKELGLSQEQAQKLVDFQVEQAKAHEASVSDYFGNLMTEWQTAVKNDKEIGGQAYDGAIADAKHALNAFGTAELKEALETTGMGNHPEFVRFFARMGKAIKEDGIRVGGTQRSDGPRDPASILYPNQK